MKTGCHVVFSLLTAAALSAAEIYVSPAGNNKNQGSFDSPFGTIAFAASKAKPGDRVKIMPGVYREQITFTRSGKKGAPITFVGSRGKNGEFLSIVEAPGRVITDWKPAPEIGKEVWKAKLPNRPDLVMMDGKMIACINRLTMALPRWKKLPVEMNENMFWSKFGPNCKRLPGFDLLNMPKDFQVTHQYFRGRKEKFWPVIDYVLSGWHDGFIYLRFANGDTPGKHTFTALKGEGFILKNVSHLNFKDLHLRGSRCQFRLMGKSSYNTIDNCLLMHGGARVRIDEKVSHTTVRDSVLTAGFIRNDLFKLRSAEDMRGGLLYLIFKYIIGFSSSDDVGINDKGSKTRILNNIIIQGLIGMDAYGAGCEVKDNVVREMSSVGICTGPTTAGIFTGNLVMNCGIPLRIHDLRGKRAHREEYHFRNLFIQARHGGSQVFVHCESYRWGPDMVNFEKGTKNYKKNPPDPVDAGKIYIYHNTFWGGGDFDGGFSVGYLSRRFRMVMPFFFVNNIIKGVPRHESLTQELFNNNLLYTFNQKARDANPRDPRVAQVNHLIGLDETGRIWNKKDLPGLPDVTLSKDSPALGCGIDISKPFTANGKKFPAFPGFAPGYFKGKAPAAGAFQAGESQQKFCEMHKKAERAVAALDQLREK